MINSVGSTTDVTQGILNEMLSSEETNDNEIMSTDEIIREVKQNSTLNDVTTQDIIDDYGVTMTEAQEIIDEIQETENNTMPDYSSFYIEA